MDVRTPEELDEEELSEAAAALKDSARALAFCGMRGPQTLTTPPATASAAYPPVPSAPSAAGVGVALQGWTSFDESPPRGGVNGSVVAGGGVGRVGSVGMGLEGGAAAGWRLPWALRARVAEVLLTGEW